MSERQHRAETTRGRLARLLGGSVFASVLVAVLAFAGGTVGGLIAGQSTERAAEIAEEAEDARLVREKRSEVYSAYLDAANEYSVRTGALFSTLTETVNGMTKDVPVDVPDNALESWVDSRSAYQGLINDVYVYGSDEAWKAHQALAGTLPRSLGSIDIQSVDPATFTEAYRGFQGVFCAEALPEKRPGCGQL